MNIDSLIPWIGIVSSLSALIIGLVTALWAYTKYIVERGLLPPTQFEIECNSVGNQYGTRLLEIILHLRNCGGSTLIATNVRVDIRYLTDKDVPQLIHLDGTEQTPGERQRKHLLFGRVDFKWSVRRQLEAMASGVAAQSQQQLGHAGEETFAARFLRVLGVTRKAGKRQPHRKHRGVEKRGFGLMQDDTFVQAGVDQQYSFQTALAESATYVLVWASFEYAQSPKAVQRAVLWLSRRLGLIQFSLQHVSAPHTAERVFKM